MGNTCFRPSPVKVDPSFTSEVSFTSDDGRRSEVQGREISDTEIEQKINSVLLTFKSLGQKQSVLYS